MQCAKKALALTMVTLLLGLWGCTQNAAPSSGSARLRELEARSARLEDDFKTAIATREQARKKVTVLEEQRAQLLQQVDQLQRLAKERDELRQQIQTRTAERDALQANLAQFGRELQTLAARIDQAANYNGNQTAPIATGPVLPVHPAQE